MFNAKDAEALSAHTLRDASGSGRLREASAAHPPVARAKVGLLLVNLGTPDATDFASMRRYLREFLWDRRVIEPPPSRPVWWLILNAFILTKRPRTSGEAYKSIWNEAADESPLLTTTKAQVAGLRERITARFGERVVVDYCMRYGNPSTITTIQRMMAEGCERIVFFPLYPQYSATTTGTANDQAFRALMGMRWQPALRTVPPYHDHPLYIEALARSIEIRLETRKAEGRGLPDVLVCSYHGLPRRYHENGDPYACHCFKTTRLLRERLALSGINIEATFQSRFGTEEWLQPYTVERVAELAQQGKRDLMICAPGFVTDCVETLEEIKGEIRESFEEAGGDFFDYIPCLNTDKAHLDLIEDIAVREISGWI